MALSPDPNHEYLVEHYLPEADADLLIDAASRLEAEAHTRAWKVTAIVVPGDRSVLSLVAAPSQAHVRALCRAAGVHVDRISEAIRVPSQPIARRTR
jgi:hypothetical protein